MGHSLSHWRMRLLVATHEVGWCVQVCHQGVGGSTTSSLFKKLLPVNHLSFAPQFACRCISFLFSLESIQPKAAAWSLVWRSPTTFGARGRRSPNCEADALVAVPRSTTSNDEHEALSQAVLCVAPARQPTLPLFIMPRAS